MNKLPCALLCVLLAITLDRCGAQEPPAPERVMDAPGRSSGPLAPEFPEVLVAVRTSFAHDRGDVTSIDSLTVCGRPVELGDALAAVVAHRQGWTAQGGSADQEVLRTVTAWEQAWIGLLGVRCVEQASDLPDAPLRGEELPAWHAPRASLHTLPGGERVVAFSYWSTGDAGARGRGYWHEVDVYRLKDGTRWTPPEDEDGDPAPRTDDLPRSGGFTTR